MGRNSRSKRSGGLGFSQKDKFIGYILFQPQHEDYLAKVSRNGTAWCSYPQNAFKFVTKQKAKEMALDLVSEKPIDYRLMICRLYDVGQQFKVEQFEVVEWMIDEKSVSFMN
jgi:hypothetical protein